MKAVAVMLLLCASVAFAQPPKHDDVIMNISLTGAETVPAEIKQAIQKELGHTFTGRDDVPGEINYMEERIRDQFQQYGYFKALVLDPQRKEKWDNGVLKEIDLTVKIDEGGRYKVGDIRFTNAKAFDATTLRKAVPMQQGDIFSVEKMRQGLKTIRELYCAQGYINSTPIPNAETDDEHLLINVNFDMDEGSQFRYGKLVVNGIEPRPGDREKLLDAWRTYEGQPYDCGSATKLLRLEKLGNTAAGLATALESGNVSVEINADTKTVDFHYEFPGPK